MDVGAILHRQKQNEAIQAIEMYLSKIAEFKQPTLEKFTLLKGRLFAAPEIARPKGIRKGTDRACYMNAYHIAERNDWKYVEGFAIADIGIQLPIQHAWVVNKEQVIETTWKKAGLAYYGVEFGWGFMHKILLETKRYGIMDLSSMAFREYFMETMEKENG